MKKEVIVRLHASFEEQVHKEQDGSEYWLARDLQELLGYAKWENFARVIDKASTACKGSGYDPQDHFLVLVRLSAGLKDCSVDPAFFQSRANHFRISFDFDQETVPRKEFLA